MSQTIQQLEDYFFFKNLIWGVFVTIFLQITPYPKEIDKFKGKFKKLGAIKKSDLIVYAWGNLKNQNLKVNRKPYVLV